MKRIKQVLLVAALLCLGLILYRNIAGEKKRVRTPEDGTDSEFYLYFGEKDAERVDAIILRKNSVEPYKMEAEIEITDPDLIQEITDQILALKLTEADDFDIRSLRKNAIIISFNTGGPSLKLFVGSENRLVSERITCSTDTKVVVEHELFISEQQIDFEQWWEMAETKE